MGILFYCVFVPLGMAFSTVSSLWIQGFLAAVKGRTYYPFGNYYRLRVITSVRRGSRSINLYERLHSIVQAFGPMDPPRASTARVASNPDAIVSSLLRAKKDQRTLSDIGVGLSF